MDKEDLKLLKTISANIRAARKDLKISQLELSNRCELAQSYIAGIESGKKMPSLKTIRILSENLKIKPYQLLLDEEIKMLTDNEFFYSKMEEELGGKVSTFIRDFLSEYRPSEKK